MIGCTLLLASFSVAISSAFHMVGSGLERSKRQTLPLRSPPYACSTYGFWRLAVNARMVPRPVGLRSRARVAGERDLLAAAARLERRVRIQDIQEALAAGVVVPRGNQHDPAVGVRLGQRRRVVDVAQIRFRVFPQDFRGGRRFGVRRNDGRRRGKRVGDVERVHGATSRAEPTHQYRAPVVAGRRWRRRIGVREIDVGHARRRIDIELVRVQRDSAAPEGERSELERRGRRMRRIVRIAATEQRLRNVGPGLLAAVRHGVVERMQHSVVGAHVDGRRPRRLARLERVVAWIGRTRRSGVEIRCARRTHRDGGRVDDVAQDMGPGAETGRVDAFVRLVAAQVIEHRLLRGRRRDGCSTRC